MLHIRIDDENEHWLNPKHIVSVSIDGNLVMITTRTAEYSFAIEHCKSLLAWLAMNQLN